MFDDRFIADQQPTSADTTRRWSASAQPYLAGTRARAACVREFNRIVSDVATLWAKAADALPAGSDVKQAPARCIVQAGPIALTISWVRGQDDSPANGRLLVIEWEGTVGGRPPKSTTRVPVHRVGATVIREDVFLAEAASDDDWRWRSADLLLTSTQLASHYVESFHQRAAERMLAV